MFAFGGRYAASRFILVVWRMAHTRNCRVRDGVAALQWHASRYVFHRTKVIDLAGLIVYNLSNWTGLRERAGSQGLPFVEGSIRRRERAPLPCGHAPKAAAMHQFHVDSPKGARRMNAVSEALKTEPSTSIKIDGKRLWDSLMTMAKIGATPKGGVCRLALTDLDREGRDLIVSWAKEAGCTVTVDQMGNVFMRRAGRNPDALPVMTGSHADSQPTGGRFDGIYGVLGGLEVIRSLNDHGIETEHPVEVVIWTNEEGSRFAPAMVASGVFAGVFTLEYGLSRKDVDGKTIGEELKRIGYAGDLPCGGRPLHAAFELHIEQGPILEAEQKTIGVVTDAQGQRWYEITLTGQEAHAGPTPMPRRRDALLGAARVVDLVNRIGLDNAPFGCATVGMMQVYPNSRNVIPGRVFFTVDFRHPDDAVLAKMDAALREGVANIANGIGLETALEQIFYYAPIAFDEACVKSVRAAAERFGYPHRNMVSGAGHDACYLSQVAPTSMVFVPCVDGISHNEIEDATFEWIEAGANVLLHAMLERACEPVS
jgi:N-carbamoyl-L-amino-acid hydrolase